MGAPIYTLVAAGAVGAFDGMSVLVHPVTLLGLAAIGAVLLLAHAVQD